MSGIPGLRIRSQPRSRVELFRPGTAAAVTVQLAPGEGAEAHRWIAALPQAQDPMRSAAGWTAAERASLPAYERWIGDAAARSHVLRRLMVFANLPAVTLVDASGAVPSPRDIQQLLLARQRPTPPTALGRQLSSLPRRDVVRAGRPSVLAVVSGHTPHGAGVGGQGRTTVAARLACALAGHGRRVLLVSTDPHQPLSTPAAIGHSETTWPQEVDVLQLRPDIDRLGEQVHERAAATGRDVVLLDSGPGGQQAITRAADAWLGVVGLWQQPRWGHPLLTDEVLGADGRLLPDGWEEQWLRTMRAHRWQVTWRLAPRDAGKMFAPFDPERCAGVVLLGAREVPGARAADYRNAFHVALPVLHTAIPHIASGRGSAAKKTAAYRALACELLG
ncbi:ArsA-related P-loop ATPase [Streptomyces klenkii]|uniref:nucleotide-binding protein n=1 Tax=Streptomyces klenkii TaxID=1420899 RepID=UPI003438205B